MSEDSLQLSDELISGLIDVIVKHDARTETDMMLGLQYLAAVTVHVQFVSASTVRRNGRSPMCRCLRRTPSLHPPSRALWPESKTWRLLGASL